MTLQTPLAEVAVQQEGPPVRTRSRSRRRIEPIYYLFLVPALLLFTGFVVVPAVIGIFYSFTDYVGYGSWSLLGLRNYTALFSDPDILGSYGFTLGFAVVTVVIAQVIALALAVALTKRIRFAAPLRTIFVIPMVLSGIVVAYVFNFLFSNSLPAFASAVGFAPLEQSILGNPDLAWLSIVTVSAWQTIPGALLVYTAGLTSIPGDLYEASSLDGASAWTQFRSITLPLIAGFVLINTVLGVKGYLGVYDVIVGLTGGGPGTSTRSVAMAIFGGFTGGDYAYQMANATIFFIVTVIISVAQLLVTRGRTIRL
ncbi:raffinose/stachyose/melibiose transport system permease protein [Diaminobutyricimonas aerilata]|uniref:Raffinose/stachyose/melibiose transport system permease protein n=1 Tax=Diaminobutyricimonas aerilata TaxID=1162967 RepID=A0A2M9CFW9_9MICO|nr:sugar ABC transporter permease [Diaminobutyricimonas aerilata]PJJ70768.1 raffinose/stachyose/melibiose transport system permease protein [Diaminobutyricimonas aerilata]